VSSLENIIILNIICSLSNPVRVCVHSHDAGFEKKRKKKGLKIKERLS